MTMVEWFLKLKEKWRRRKEPKPELSKTKTRCKKSPLQLREELKIEIKNDEKNINEQIFNNIFIDSIILAKQLCSSNQTTNGEIVKHINDVLIELKKVKRKQILKMNTLKR